MMNLNVITQNGSVFSKEVSFVKFFSSGGELGVFPEHTTTLTLFGSTDVVYEVESGLQESFFVGPGVASINRDNVTLLTDIYLTKDDLDESAIRLNLEDVSSSLSNLERISEQAKLRVIELTQA